MTATYLGAGSAHTSTSDGTATPTLPTGLSSGHFCIAFATGGPGDDLTGPPTVSAPDGWDLIGATFIDNPISVRDLYLAAWLHRYIPGEGTPTFVFPSSFIGSSSRGYGIVVTGWSGIVSAELAGTVVDGGGDSLGSGWEPPTSTASRTATHFQLVAHTATGAPSITIPVDHTRHTTLSGGVSTRNAALASSDSDVSAGAVSGPTWGINATATAASLAFCVASEPSEFGLTQGRLIGGTATRGLVVSVKGGARHGSR